MILLVITGKVWRGNIRSGRCRYFDNIVFGFGIFSRKIGAFRTRFRPMNPGVFMLGVLSEVYFLAHNQRFLFPRLVIDQFHCHC